MGTNVNMEASSSLGMLAWDRDQLLVEPGTLGKGWEALMWEQK